MELERLGAHVPAGVELPGGGHPLVAVEVDEAHQSWNELHALFRQWDAGQLIKTLFSKSEVLGSPWLLVVPDWHYGYPQPRELDFGYLEATFDLSEYCSDCGMGKKQKAPFQMKGEPKWGQRGILQLNWVFDEYFVTPDVWEKVFKGNGVECRPVTNIKGIPLKTVVQITTHERVGVEEAGLPFDTCGKCQRVKYLPHTRGRFPPLVGNPSGAMVKTSEYFGSGASAHQGVLVSQSIVSAFHQSHTRGVTFWPTGPGAATPS